MAPPLTAEKIVKAARKIGLEFLGKKARTSQDKYLYQCSKCSHKFLAKHNNVHSGKGCPECGRKRTANARRLDFTTVKRKSFARGWKILDSSYKNAVTPMRVECVKCGEISLKKYNWIQQDATSCAKCINRLPVTIDRFRIAAEQKNASFLKLIRDEKKNRTVALVRCKSCNREWTPTFHQLNRSGCRTCSFVTIKEKQRKTLAERQKFAESYGLDLLDTESANTNSRLTFKCKRMGHIFPSSMKVLSRGNGCPHCSESVFLNEEIVRKVFESNFKARFLKGRPKWLTYHGRGLELDGYNERLRIAFEHHGLHHYKHINFYYRGKMTLEKRRKYDGHKRRKCRENGVKLIVVKDISKLPFDQKIEAISIAIQKAGYKFRKTAIKKRVTFNEILPDRLADLKDHFLNMGWILLDTEYRGAQARYNVRCVQCGREVARFKSYVRKSNCPCLSLVKNK